MTVRIPFALTLALALVLTACGADDPAPPTSSSATSGGSASSGSPEDAGHEGEGHEEEGHEEGDEHEAADHLDTACEAELSRMQGEDRTGQVLSASVEPDLTCPQAVPAVKAINALHPVGEAPAGLSAEGFECTVEQDDFEGTAIEVFRCSDERGSLAWTRSA